MGSHNGHNLSSRDINIRSHLLAQPLPSLLDRRLDRQPSTAVQRRLDSNGCCGGLTTLQTSSERRLNRSDETVVHILELRTSPQTATRIQFFIKGSEALKHAQRSPIG